MKIDFRAIFAVYLPPLATVALLIAVWAMAVETLGLPSHLLPTPGAVGARLMEGMFTNGDMLPHIFRTLWTAAAGLALGSAAALIVAVALDEFSLLDRMFYPAIAAIQSIPKVSLAPLVLIWAGFNVGSTIILVALISFYPVFVATYGGLKSVDPNLIALCRVHRASRLFTLVHVKAPTAASHMLAGLQVAVAFALVGCVVMEFITGTGGAGFLIDNSANSLDTATAVAAMAVLGLIGAAGSLGFRLLRDTAVFWDGPAGSPGAGE
ncbi:MAG: ABC transporter permease subunit [Roseitalea porphyridii]|jgi:NitT/TauT family transport system permease protein|uniref:ABC transporter permease n=1 Tax=Roseitalea porphyridii TaxID=1852022 RepID=UPI0032EC2000